MEDTDAASYFILLIGLLVIDIICYGFGAAIQELGEADVEKIGGKKAERLTDIIKIPTRFVNTLQLLVTLVNVVLGAVHLRACANAFGRWLTWQASHNLQPLAALGSGTFSIIAMVLSTVLLMYIFLTFGVLAPKKIAAKYPEKWAGALVNFMYMLIRALSPFTLLVTVSTNLFVRLFGIDPNASADDVTEEEIISMVNEGHEQGVLQASEAEMITNIFEFGDKEAHDIMTHRKNIVAIDGSKQLWEALDFMLEGKNSRFPVYDEDIDNIIGIIHLKDAMKYHKDENLRGRAIRDIEGLIMEAKFIPETRNIDILFRSMQSLKIHMVIVVDEYGQTAGLIAMEDILEEIVGNILDEYDEEESHIEEQEDHSYVMDGLTTLEELEDKFDISFDTEDFDTLNGLLISKLGRIPEEDEEFTMEWQGYSFKILQVENKIIKSVQVEKLQSPVSN